MIIKETKRLLIEQATLTDSDFFFTLLNSPTWLQYIGDRGIETQQDAITYIENSLMTSYSEHGFGLWKVSLKESGVPLGICGFLKRDYMEHPDIGFAILPKFEGKGYMTEAAKAVLEYGKLELGLQKVLAVTTGENQSSRQLLATLGFKEDGTIELPKTDTVFIRFAKTLDA